MINLTSVHTDASAKTTANKTTNLASLLFADSSGETASSQDSLFLQMLQNTLPGVSAEQLAALMSGQSQSGSTNLSDELASNTLGKTKKDSKDDTSDSSLASLMASMFGVAHQQTALSSQLNNQSSDADDLSQDFKMIDEANSAVSGVEAADVAAISPEELSSLFLKSDAKTSEADGSDFSSELLNHIQEAKGRHAVQNVSTDVAVDQSSQMSVDVPVGDDAWANAMSQRVLMMAGQDLQSAELHLNPPNLGPVSVRLDIQNQEASVSFSSPHLAVREAIQSAAPQLIEMFSGSGLSLANVNVGSQQSEQRQAQGKSDGKSSSKSIGNIGAVTATAETDATVAPTVITKQIGLDGLAVDTFI
ncbi:flagellar hook-length control protein FliK [Leeia sp. TBRC 13508]|uniref:Flagellar hook-length control protein FliK n=1 Tax=Leeia speluncae TaxID=2884804 RepID=A0ABS8DAK1_9NEIS|nr:flagellar hook-length control protein FliK [Leeia speluncae]MCB6185243.1 flagellar hook-length control protein FliK [Leeia speluncae]